VVLSPLDSSKIAYGINYLMFRQK